MLGESIYWPWSDSGIKSNNLSPFWSLVLDCSPWTSFLRRAAVLVVFSLLFWTSYTSLGRIQQNLKLLVCPDAPELIWWATVERRAGTCLLGPVKKRARTSAASGTVREPVNQTAFLPVGVMEAASLWLQLSSSALCLQHKHLCDFIPASDGAQPVDHISSPRRRARTHQRPDSIPSLISIFFLNDCWVSFFSHSVDKQPQWHPAPPPPVSAESRVLRRCRRRRREPSQSPLLVLTR